MEILKSVCVFVFSWVKCKGADVWSGVCLWVLEDTGFCVTICTNKYVEEAKNMFWDFEEAYIFSYQKN